MPARDRPAGSPGTRGPQAAAADLRLRPRLPRLSLLLLALVMRPGVPAAAQEAAGVGSRAARSPVYAPRGAVATSQPLASSAGLAVLRAGGNAVDAAVTAAAVLSLVEPHMTGPGGDAFALVWSAEDGRLHGLDASGRAGAGMSREAFLERGHEGVPLRGAEAVTVPGALSGWAALLDRFGTLSLADALRPAIELAEEGFPVSPVIARQWAAEEELLRRDAGARATFLVDGRRAPEPGEWFRNPDLAATFRLIAREGPGVLYGGELGRRIVERVRELGGFLTLDDLARHRPAWVEPLAASFRGHRVWELPPAGQGIAALQMLRLLEPFELQAMGHNSAAYLHHLIEATKIAFADLGSHVGDPDHMRIDPERLIADDYIRERRTLLDPRRAGAHPEPGRPATEGETVYLAAADERGNMVSFINSIYEHFGSGIVVPGTGFALQNRGAGFTLEPDHPNTAAPGKRPLHTLIPGFVTRPGGRGGPEGEGGGPAPDAAAGGAGEEPWLSFGVMGGSMQPQGHVQVLLSLVLFGMDAQEAIDAPRFRHLSGRTVALEAAVPLEVRRELEAMGHDVVVEEDPSWSWQFGGAQAVMRLERGWAAGSDPRKDGAAAGY